MSTRPTTLNSGGEPSLLVRRVVQNADPAYAERPTGIAEGEETVGGSWKIGFREQAGDTPLANPHNTAQWPVVAVDGPHVMLWHSRAVPTLPGLGSLRNR